MSAYTHSNDVLVITLSTIVAVVVTMSRIMKQAVDFEVNSKLNAH